MDDELVEQLRRRAETGDDPDAEASYRAASGAASGRRRRRRVVLTGVAACAVLVVGAVFIAVAVTGSNEGAQVAIAPRDGDPPATTDRTALQFRPVLSSVAVADPAVPVDDAAGRAALASCDVGQVGSLGQGMPTTPASEVDPQACVVLAIDDGSGQRYLLGPSVLDASGVADARKSFQSGNGWGVDLTFTPAGAEALDELARRQFHSQMALVAEGVLVAAPTVQPADSEFTSFGGTVRMTLGDTEAGADAIVRAAREGA
jgi:preprotein translocase subunit SecD